MLNDQTYVTPKVPTIFSVLTTGNFSTNPEIYGVGTNAFILEKNQVIEIVLNNDDPGKHPFHLHGHNFQVIYRSVENAGDYAGNSSEDAFPKIPIRRDTIQVRPQGNLVLRFMSNNPGVWLFHCHIEW
jgi:iron transport multicopper oxidase